MKIVVFYYSQTGQACDVAHSIFDTPDSNGKNLSPDCQVVYKEIVPLQAYPYPWSRYEFFDTFPETRLYMPPSGIQPIELNDVTDADLAVVVGQSWFLSPSLPLQSFFADSDIRTYLSNRNVVFVNVCRNMWLKTAEWMKNTLKTMNAHFVGHIVLQDREANLVSAATVVRWLIHGQKEATRMLPRAGVSEKDISEAGRFGDIIRQTLSEGSLSKLQTRLLNAGAIDYKPSILRIEKIGHRIFGVWAPFIRKKGGFRDIRRKSRVSIFYYYLLVALFCVSPIAQLLFYVTYPFQRVEKNKSIDCSV